MLKLKGIRATLSMPTMDAYSREVITELCDEVERLQGAVTGSALAAFSNAEKEIDKLRETLHRIAYEYMTPEELRKTSDVECLGFEEVLSMAYENIQSEARAVLDED